MKERKKEGIKIQFQFVNLKLFSLISLYFSPDITSARCDSEPIIFDSVLSLSTIDPYTEFENGTLSLTLTGSLHWTMPIQLGVISILILPQANVIESNVYQSTDASARRDSFQCVDDLLTTICQPRAN